MKRVILSVLLALCVAVVSGCADLSIPLEYAFDSGTSFDEAELYTVSVAVTDDRPYVLSGNKEPWFTGKYRTTFGIPHDAPSRGGVHLAHAVARDLAQDLRNAGFRVVQENAERQILVSIMDYNFDCYMNCRVWHTLHVTIKDASGTTLKTKVADAEQKVSARVAEYTMPRTMPEIYTQMIQGLIRNDAEAVSFLKRPSDEPAVILP